jgi:hypothetical protein
MRTLLHASVALVVAGTAGIASAQTYYTREPLDVRPVINDTLQLTPSQRTTIYRTIVPQGRGRAPIVRERIVIEPAAPVVQERIVRSPAPVYAAPTYSRPGYDDYAYAGDYALAVGSPVPRAAPLAPFPQPLVTRVPVLQGYKYMVINNRLLLVDPATSVVVADLTQ